MRGDRAALQIVDRAPNHQGEKNPNAVMQENAEGPQDVGATVFLQVGKEGTQVLEEHELVDEILPAPGAH